MAKKRRHLDNIMTSPPKRGYNSYRYNVTQPTDAVISTVNRTSEKIYKASKRDIVQEKKEREQPWVTKIKPRQTYIEPYREKTDLDKAGGRLFAAAEEQRKQEEINREGLEGLKALFKPVMPSTYIDLVNAYKKGQISGLNSAIAAAYSPNSWSERNPDEALAIDIISPILASKGISLLKNASRGYRLAKSINKSLKNTKLNFTPKSADDVYGVLDNVEPYQLDEQIIPISQFADFTNMPPAAPNWQGSWTALTLDRLKNGGLDRLAKASTSLRTVGKRNAALKAEYDAGLAHAMQAFKESGLEYPDMQKLYARRLNALRKRSRYNPSIANDLPYYEPYRVPTIEEITSTPVRISNIESGETKMYPGIDWSAFNENLTRDVAGNYNTGGGWIETPTTKVIPRPYADVDMTIAHEVAHKASAYNDSSLDWFDFERLLDDGDPKGLYNYFHNHGGTELAARGSQLKNYYGLRENQPLTESMWDYAVEHYVPDTEARGMLDNHMSDFFHYVKDKKKAIAWLNKWAPVFIPAVFAAKTYKSK